MTLLYSRGSTNSLTDASITTTERESAFKAYAKVLEDQVTALKDDAHGGQCLNMCHGRRRQPPLH